VLTVSGGAGIWGADRFPCRACRCRNYGPIQAGNRRRLLAVCTVRRATRIDVTAQGVHSGGLQKSIDLLDVSDEVDGHLVVLSLSSVTRMPFKQAELKHGDRTPRTSPIVFYSYTLPSDFARTNSRRRAPWCCRG